MSSEAIIAAGYAGALLACALILEWLSAHTHRRSLRYRTAGFEYSEQHDAWVCPEGEHLWLHEHDHERRLIRYRAKAHVCNACPVKDRCTDSDEGREIVQPMDPWPHFGSWALPPRDLADAGCPRGVGRSRGAHSEPRARGRRDA